MNPHSTYANLTDEERAGLDARGRARTERPCGVTYSTPGVCGWCRWPKSDHEQVRPLVHVCPVCGDRYHDPSWDDIDEHWQTHMSAHPANMPEREAKP